VFKAPRPARPVVTAPPVQRRPVEVRPVPAPAPAPVIYVEERGTATVLTLGSHMCKWPIGDPATDEFTFCGRRAGAEGPYCVEHARVAYQPQQAKKKSGSSDLARSLRRYI
jgi:GcrA cell cycle regulator